MKAIECNYVFTLKVYDRKPSPSLLHFYGVKGSLIILVLQWFDQFFFLLILTYRNCYFCLQVGSASDEKMLSLLDSALQADTVAIVRKARELIDSGVEPLSLMSRLATSITDILAGSFKFTENQSKGFFRKQPCKYESIIFLSIFFDESILKA